MDIQIKTLPHFDGLALPHYATPFSAGMDLRCAAKQTFVLEPGQRWAAPTGLTLAIPPGFEGQVRPRSGLALRQGLTVINSPGTIDADYRGEIKIALINLGQEAITIERGMRIAQLVIAPIQQISWQKVTALPDSQRSTGGFGHTGSS